jgi:hypothetical protein
MTKRTKHSSYGKILLGALVLLGHLSCFGIEEGEDTNDTGVGSDSDVDSDTDTDVDSNTDTNVVSDTDTESIVDTDTNKVLDTDTVSDSFDSDYTDIDQCCSDPGQMAECWWNDAERDGVLCSDSQPCPNGRQCITVELSPEGMGRCACNDSSDCNNGADMNGVCVIEPGETEGVCGPSYCNGYLVCSCWGGCVDGEVNREGYDTPEEFCEAATEFGDCIESSYPSISDGYALGRCVDNPVCDPFYLETVFGAAPQTRYTSNEITISCLNESLQATLSYVSLQASDSNNCEYGSVYLNGNKISTDDQFPAEIPVKNGDKVKVDLEIAEFYDYAGCILQIGEYRELFALSPLPVGSIPQGEGSLDAPVDLNEQTKDEYNAYTVQVDTTVSYYKYDNTDNDLYLQVNKPTDLVSIYYYKSNDFSSTPICSSEVGSPTITDLNNCIIKDYSTIYIKVDGSNTKEGAFFKLAPAI